MAVILGCALMGAQPACAASQIAQVSATVAKPLILTRVQDLDLGTITLGPGSWSGATVGISRGGVFRCTNANVICTGATRPAIYNVSGTNNRAVQISAPNVTLVNQSDATKTLTLVPDVVSGVTLTNSGPPGTNFNVGGSITVSSTTAAGTYSGTFNVTVDY
jgi:hypothetical protein